MQTFIKTLIPVVLMFTACTEPQSNTAISVTDTIQNKMLLNTTQQQIDRLSVTGDFNGDGVADTVMESYI